MQEPFEKGTGGTSHKPRQSPPSVFWPLVFIAAGIFLLLANLGYLSGELWDVLWRLWPLLLVALGVDQLIGRHSVIGAIFSALFMLVLIGGVVVAVFFAQNVPVR